MGNAIRLPFNSVGILISDEPIPLKDRPSSPLRDFAIRLPNARDYPYSFARDTKGPERLAPEELGQFLSGQIGDIRGASSVHDKLVEAHNAADLHLQNTRFGAPGQEILRFRNMVTHLRSGARVPADCSGYKAFYAGLLLHGGLDRPGDVIGIGAYARLSIDREEYAVGPHDTLAVRDGKHWWLIDPNFDGPVRFDPDSGTARGQTSDGHSAVLEILMPYRIQDEWGLLESDRAREYGRRTYEGGGASAPEVLPPPPPTMPPRALGPPPG
jgi:hypothetical protein